MRTSIQRTIAQKDYAARLRGEGNPNYRHGAYLTDKKLYFVWGDMRSRTSNPSHARAKHYVLRGISCCEEWSNFAVFREWAQANGYSAGLTLDRIDNDGNYCPNNCRWVTNTVNTRNSRRAKIDAPTTTTIKNLLKSGASCQKVASVVGCSIHIVSDISSGRTWRGV